MKFKHRFGLSLFIFGVATFTQVNSEYIYANEVLFIALCIAVVGNILFLSD
jgi:hypothetical protein